LASFILHIGFVCLLLTSFSAAADYLSEAQQRVKDYEEQQSLLANFFSSPQAGQADAQEKILAYQKRSQTLLNEARKLYELAQVSKSRNVKLLQEYARILRIMGDFDLAAENLAVAIRYEPASALLWQTYASDLTRCGPSHRKQAFSALRSALQLEQSAEGRSETLYLLGALYHQEGLMDLARESYVLSLESKDSHILAHIGMAALEVRDGQVLEGSARLDQLGRAVQPHDAFIRELLRQALRDFDTARRHFPDTAAHHLAYGKTLYRAARVQEALVAVGCATRRDPDNAVAWKFLGDMNLQLGSTTNALSAYQSSLIADPGQPHVQQLVSQLLAQTP
jgi:tetratricopeptide (TPR) repeat protein